MAGGTAAAYSRRIMAVPSQTIDLRSWGLLLLLSLLWGASYLFVAIAVRDLAPLVIVMARVMIAAAVLLPLHFILIGPLPRNRRAWLAILGMSVFNNVIPFTLIVTGQTMIASGLASVINATTPLFAVSFIAAAGFEPLVKRKVIGIVIGIMGVAVLKGGTIFGAGSQSIGILLCLGAAASYGLGSLWARARLTGIPPLTAATCQLLGSSAIMAILASFFASPTQLLGASRESWLALLGLAVISTAIAYLVFFTIIERSGPANVQLVTMMIPPSAIAMGYLVLNETLELQEIAGALIIIGALAVIDGRVFGRFPKTVIAVEPPGRR